MSVPTVSLHLTSSSTETDSQHLSCLGHVAPAGTPRREPGASPAPAAPPSGVEHLP